uniref:Uncharacterized protein n=1 Tax=Astyanax mexicanus TaxID=7994 RepID=A0A8B9RKA8_ASTMX
MFLQLNKGNKHPGYNHAGSRRIECHDLIYKENVIRDSITYTEKRMHQTSTCPGGVKYISSLIYEENVIRDGITYTEH